MSENRREKSNVVNFPKIPTSSKKKRTNVMWIVIIQCARIENCVQELRSGVLIDVFDKGGRI